MFLEFLKLGITHILDINGVDHILFLVGLSIIYTIKDWKTVVWLATAFTLGHSITLALSAIDVIKVDSNIIEILIALSIFLVAIFNIILPHSTERLTLLWRYISAGIFGLIHGIGFSNFFSIMLSGDSLTIPLLGFNIGVEIAQVLIVGAVLIISFIISKYYLRKLYVNMISGIIAIWAIKLIIERIM